MDEEELRNTMEEFLNTMASRFRVQNPKLNNTEITRMLADAFRNTVLSVDAMDRIQNLLEAQLSKDTEGDEVV